MHQHLAICSIAPRPISLSASVAVTVVVLHRPADVAGDVSDGPAHTHTHTHTHTLMKHVPHCGAHAGIGLANELQHVAARLLRGQMQMKHIAGHNLTRKPQPTTSLDEVMY